MTTTRALDESGRPTAKYFAFRDVIASAQHRQEIPALQASIDSTASTSSVLARRGCVALGRGRHPGTAWSSRGAWRRNRTIVRLHHVSHDTARTVAGHAFRQGCARLRTGVRQRRPGGDVSIAPPGTGHRRDRRSRWRNAPRYPRGERRRARPASEGPSHRTERDHEVGDIRRQGDPGVGCLHTPDGRCNPRRAQRASVMSGPRFYRGEFAMGKPADTFLDTRGWGKGAILRGRLATRSAGFTWEIGPQPGCRPTCRAHMVAKGKNEVVVFDLCGAGSFDDGGSCETDLEVTLRRHHVGSAHFCTHVAAHDAHTLSRCRGCRYRRTGGRSEHRPSDAIEQENPASPGISAGEDRRAPATSDRR